MIQKPFLVLGPSLHNTNPEESLCSTAYLELFIRSITSKPLLKCLLQFIVLHEHEGVPIIETLTQRLGKLTFDRFNVKITDFNYF